MALPLFCVISLGTLHPVLPHNAFSWTQDDATMLSFDDEPSTAKVIGTWGSVDDTDEDTDNDGVPAVWGNNAGGWGDNTGAWAQNTGGWGDAWGTGGWGGWGRRRLRTQSSRLHRGRKNIGCFGRSGLIICRRPSYLKRLERSYKLLMSRFTAV